MTGALELGAGDVARDLEADVVRLGNQFIVEQFLVAFEIRLGLFKAGRAGGD